MKFDWRMSQSCAHTLLTLDLDEAPPTPPQPRASHAAQRGQAGLAEEAQLLKDSSDHSAGARAPQYTALDSSPAQGGGVRGPSPADSRSLYPSTVLSGDPGRKAAPSFSSSSQLSLMGPPVSVARCPDGKVMVMNCTPWSNVECVDHESGTLAHGEAPVPGELATRSWR